jgi:hypothetical protein
MGIPEGKRQLKDLGVNMKIILKKKKKKVCWEDLD